MARRSEAEVARRFRERYQVSGTDAQLRLERLVLGSDHGANGWTTLEQADVLADRLQLRPGDRLLDFGAGRGWPGVYLGETTGCDVVIVDRPVEGLRHGLDRAGRRSSASRCWAVAASAAAQPFREASFDAVVHADVLC